MSRHPLTKWAQRKDRVYLTIELPDAKDVSLKLQADGSFHFSAKSGASNILYELDLELFGSVNVDESKAAVAPRSICYLIKKAENKWWSRLLKREGKAPVFLMVDWDKWVDEDEDDAEISDNMDFGAMDFSKMGMDGDDGNDDDEDDDDNDDAVDSKAKFEDEMMAEVKKNGVASMEEEVVAEAALSSEAAQKN